ARRTPDQPAGARPTGRAVRQYPEFPREEPGQKARFWALVIAWPFQAGWVLFNRFPKWIRITAYAWLFVAVLVKGCSGRDEERPQRAAHEQANKSKQLADNYEGSADSADATEAAKIGTQIAQQYMRAAAPASVPAVPGAAATTPGPTVTGAPGSTADASDSTAAASLVVIPFSSPKSDPAARKLAGSTFGQLYGRLAISHHGRVSLANKPSRVPDINAAADLG